jgi:uncharacterized phage-associated protein
MSDIKIYDSIDIARHLLAECYDRNIKDISNTKINKLLYIVYGLYLALYDSQILTEKPKYFPYGPVFPRVYKNYNDLSPLRLLLSEELQGVVDDVFDSYGDTPAGVLSSWSHEEGSPGLHYKKGMLNIVNHLIMTK